MQTIIPHPTDDSKTYWTGVCNDASDNKGRPFDGIFSQIIKRIQSKLLPYPDTIRTVLSHCLDKKFLKKIQGNEVFTNNDLSMIGGISTDNTEIKKQLLTFLRKGLQKPSFLTDGLTKAQIDQQNKRIQQDGFSAIPFNLREFEQIFTNCKQIIISSEHAAADAGVATVPDATVPYDAGVATVPDDADVNDADDDDDDAGVPDAANAAAVVNSPSNPSGDIVAPSIPYRRNKSTDIEKTRYLTLTLHENISTILPTLAHVKKLELIHMLEKTPEMLEFTDDQTVLVHSYYSQAYQYLTKNKTICEKSKEVRDLLQAYYGDKKSVRLTNKLEGICLSSTQLTSSDYVPADDVHAAATDDVPTADVAAIPYKNFDEQALEDAAAALAYETKSKSDATRVTQRATYIKKLPEYNILTRVLAVAMSACIDKVPLAYFERDKAIAAITSVFTTSLEELIASLAAIPDLSEQKNKKICKEITKLFEKLDFGFLLSRKITGTVFIHILPHNSHRFTTPDCIALSLFHSFLINLKTKFNPKKIKVSKNHEQLELQMNITFEKSSSYNDSLITCSRVVQTTTGGRSRRKSKYKSNTTHRHKHRRKTHHKHTRKTRGKRKHRSRAARKHKKYSRRR